MEASRSPGKPAPAPADEARSWDSSPRGPLDSRQGVTDQRKVEALPQALPQALQHVVAEC